MSKPEPAWLGEPVVIIDYKGFSLNVWGESGYEAIFGR
jgi:hypothetical protein